MAGGLAAGRARLARRLLAPALLVVFLLGVLPVASQLALAFFRFPLRGAGERGFAGFANFTALLRDDVFWQDLGQTLLFTGVSVTLEMALGLGAALVLRRIGRARTWLGPLLILPWALPTVVAATMWSFLWNDRLGFVNAVLLRAGLLDGPVVWLGPGLALPAIIIADVWKTTPFVTLVLAAGLRTIPAHVREAAALDGAASWQVLRNITLPLLRPFLAIALLFRVMDAFRVFDLVWVLTGGAHHTESLSIYVYRLLFRYGELGSGSAAAVALFALGLALSLGLLRAMRVPVRARG